MYQAQNKGIHPRGKPGLENAFLLQQIHNITTIINISNTILTNNNSIFNISHLLSNDNGQDSCEVRIAQNHVDLSHTECVCYLFCHD